MSEYPERYGGTVGSRHGYGASDHDEPYEFGRKPRVDCPGLLTLRELAALLRLRGRLQDGAIYGDGPPSAGRSVSPDGHRLRSVSIHGDKLWIGRENDLLQGRMEAN